MTHIYQGPGHPVRYVRDDKRVIQRLLSTPHTYTGPKWTAYDIMAMPQSPNARPDTSAQLASYLLHCPNAHPFWSWFMFSAVHLREIPDVIAPHLRTPDCTHEFLVITLDPDIGDPSTTDLRNWLDGKKAAGMKTSGFLYPLDLIHQVEGATDEWALELARLMMQAFCDGHTSPESDYRNKNISMIDGTLAHLKKGRHVVH